MNFIKTQLDGVYEIENKKIEDYRGSFVKTFNKSVFSEHGLDSDFKESFYSISKKNVLRGMHFQLPPYDHAKLVYVTQGEILDVVVDIRKLSPTYGKYFSIRLSDKNRKSLYMEKGFAHGFLTLSDSATVVYLINSEYSPEHDTGIHWNSFGFNWPNSQPIISKRDELLLDLTDIK